MPVSSSRGFGTVWFRGVRDETCAGPQAAMFNNAEHDRHQCYVKLEVPNRRAHIDPEVRPVSTYGSYQTHQQFAAAILSIPELSRCFYEIVPITRPVRLYFDIEWVVGSEFREPQPMTRVTDLIQHVNEKLVQLNPGCAPEVKIACGSRAKSNGFKHSYHLVYTNVYFERVDTAMKHFVLQHLTLPSEVDRSVYTKNRCMRTILSHKCGDTVGLQAVEGEANDLLPYMITVPPRDGNVLVTEAMVNYTAPKFKPKNVPVHCLTRGPANKTRVPAQSTNQADQSTEFLDYVLSELKKFGFKDATWVGPYNDGMKFSWDISEPDPLDLPERLTYHESDSNAMVTWDESKDEVYINSFGRRVHRKRARLCSVSGRRLPDQHGQRGWSFHHFQELLTQSQAADAKAHARRFVFITNSGNKPQMVTQTWNPSTRGREFHYVSLVSGVKNLNQTVLRLPRPPDANKDLLAIEAGLDECDHQLGELEARVQALGEQFPEPGPPPEFEGTVRQQNQQRRVYTAEARVARAARQHALRPIERERAQLERRRQKLVDKHTDVLEDLGNESVPLGTLLKSFVDISDDAVYKPDMDLPKGCINLFDGYAAERLEHKFQDRSPGVTQPIHWHILNVLCNKDQDAYHFFLRFLAWLVQNPSEKPGVCCVFSSAAGVGKGEMEKFLRTIIGQDHVITVSDDQSLVGGFNIHMDNKLLVIANELGCLGAAHRASNKLKSLISDSRQLFTAKTVDSKERVSVAGVIMFTNHDEVIRIEQGDRRYFIIQCNNDLANQPEYFKKLKAAMADERVQLEFFRELRDMDLSNVHLGSSIPATEMRADLIDCNRSIIEQFLLHEAESRHNDYTEAWYAAALHTRVLRYLKELGRDTKFYSIKKMAIELRKVPGVQVNHTKYGTQYTLPELDDLKKQLDLMLKTAPKMSEIDVERYMSRYHARPDGDNDGPPAKRRKIEVVDDTSDDSDEGM